MNDRPLRERWRNKRNPVNKRQRLLGDQYQPDRGRCFSSSVVPCWGEEMPNFSQRSTHCPFVRKVVGASSKFHVRPSLLCKCQRTTLNTADPPSWIHGVVVLLRHAICVKGLATPREAEPIFRHHPYTHLTPGGFARPGRRRGESARGLGPVGSERAPIFRSSAKIVGEGIWSRRISSC